MLFVVSISVLFLLKNRNGREEFMHLLSFPTSLNNPFLRFNVGCGVGGGGKAEGNYQTIASWLARGSTGNSFPLLRSAALLSISPIRTCHLFSKVVTYYNN